MEIWPSKNIYRKSNMLRFFSYKNSEVIRFEKMIATHQRANMTFSWVNKMTVCGTYYDKQI